jgi:hypothetical protein
VTSCLGTSPAVGRRRQIQVPLLHILQEYFRRVLHFRKLDPGTRGTSSCIGQRPLPFAVSLPNFSVPKNHDGSKRAAFVPRDHLKDPGGWTVLADFSDHVQSTKSSGSDPGKQLARVKRISDWPAITDTGAFQWNHSREAVDDQSPFPPHPSTLHRQIRCRCNSEPCRSSLFSHSGDRSWNHRRGRVFFFLSPSKQSRYHTSELLNDYPPPLESASASIRHHVYSCAPPLDARLQGMAPGRIANI